MSEAIIINREDQSAGIDMYFHNLSSLMIYQYEIIYQLEGTNWRNYSKPWTDANLYLTNGKDNARTEVHEFSHEITKSAFNLKKILNIGPAYYRIKTIGKFCNIGMDILDLQALFNDEIWDYLHAIEDINDPSEFDFEEWIDSLMSAPYKTRSLEMLDPDIMNRFITSNYGYNMMRDDLGMIQNTMRKIIKL